MRSSIRIPLLLLAAAVLPATACNQETATPTSLTGQPGTVQAVRLPGGHPVFQQIADLLEERWIAAFEAGDYPGVAALYTEDAWLMPPDFPLLVGRAAVAAYYEALIAAFPPGTTVRFEVVEVEHYGNAASAVAIYRATLAGAVLDQGHLVKLFRRMAGEWQIHRSMFRSDGPAI
jgi:uncharacterized protein (TIGR02246 family)